MTNRYAPEALLSVIGRNMVGRLQVAPPGAALDEPAKPIEVAELLKGDNSEDAFSQLVRERARSGVSDVLPKFLDTEQKKQVGLGPHKKASLLTHEHIIKGSSSKLPFATANEHLCMQVAAKVVESAKTELSQDGNVLVVRWFDVDKNGKPFRALEDFCALLGLRPSAKYETTWERISEAAADTAPAVRELMNGLAGFKDTGKRMLPKRLRGRVPAGEKVLKKIYSPPQWRSINF